MAGTDEEGRGDGSIRTEYAKELSELLPLINFWLMPSVFPADAEGIRHKCRFIAEVLSAMGLPIIEDEMYGRTEEKIDSLLLFDIVNLDVLQQTDFAFANENKIYRTGVIGQFNITFELA